MKRRDFLQTAGLSTGFLVTDGMMAGTEDGKSNGTGGPSNASRLPRRDFGDTGVQLSIVGFGAIVIMNAESEYANRLVAEAVERGVNYFDAAHTYGDAEERLGSALAPYREKVFLSTKTAKRDREGAAADLERSLDLLRTDHIDFYQIHALTDIQKDVDPLFAKDGAMETLLERKAAGQIRFLGFSAHSVEAALAAIDRYPFDHILLPVHFVSWYKGNFGPQIMAKAVEKGIPRIGIKAMARQRRPKDDPTRRTGEYGKRWYQYLADPHELELASRFALSQPVTTIIPPGDESLFRLALDLAMRFEKITPEEEEELKALAEPLDPMFPIM